MPAGQPTKHEMETRQVSFDLQGRRGLVVNGAWVTGWDGNLGSLDRIDPITTTPKAAPARSHEIKMDERHHVLASSASSDGLAVRVGLIASALVASAGLAWVVISTLPLPFDLAWLGGSNGYHFLDKNAAPSSLPEQSLHSSDSFPVAEKGDRLEIHGPIIREKDRRAPAEAADSLNRKLVELEQMGLATPSLGTAPPAPFESKRSTVAEKHTASVERKAGNLQSRAKLTPTPETRPTTIEGWMLREVINGTAVLEGPNGIWRVTRGDTVPEVGRVDSIIRWGNRWIVATSRGLISTP